MKNISKLFIAAALLTAGTAFAEDSTESITIHNTTFDVVVKTGSKLDGSATLSSSNFALTGPTSGSSAYTPGTSIQGLYLADGVGVKFNHSGNVTVTYLYIGENITMKSSTGNTAGQINWSNTTQGGQGILSMSSTSGAWVDIRANYGSNISLANMASGSVYLNDFGALSSTLATTNTVYATAVFDTGKINASNSYALDTATGTVTRTLLTGDFSSWTSLTNLSSLVQLSGVSSYTISATSEGLKVSYTIPEPSAFGLLAGLGALALAGTRRRRKKA